MPGAPNKISTKSIDDYLEIMSKSVFQAGMSWKVIESKWPETREAFQGFDINTVANYHEKDIEDFTKDKRVIRNFRKLNAIVTAQAKRIEDLKLALERVVLRLSSMTPNEGTKATIVIVKEARKGTK